MISKKVPTLQQRVLLRCLDAAEKLGEAVPYIMTVGVTCLALVINQKVLNSTTYENCPININVLVTHKTVLGDALVCVSRMEINGPAAPLRD